MWARALTAQIPLGRCSRNEAIDADAVNARVNDSRAAQTCIPRSQVLIMA
jgi:hypothetical protein